MVTGAATHGIWHATAHPRSHPALHGDHRADVVVVGAGITGLTTALLLARTGVDVVVVEALRVASGVTGRTTAKVTSQHTLLYSQIASKHSEDTARVYAEANQAAVEQVAELVDAGDIDCAFERRPAYTYTRDASYLSKVNNEAELCRRLGLPASFTTDTDGDLPFDVVAAVRFDNQAQLQPVAYCDGLARMLVAADGRIFEQTRVTGVTGGAPLKVTTERGSIAADAVVLATHIPFLDRGMFFAKVEPSASHGIAVETDGRVPHGMYITAESPSRSVRSFRHDGRSYLIVVGESHRTGEGNAAEHERALIDWASRHWRGTRIAHTWMAQDYTPQDSVPYIGRLTRRSGPIYVATGFQKWGLSNGTAAALLLSDLAVGQDHPWASVFDANRLTPAASTKAFVEHNVTAAAHLVGDSFQGTPLSEIDALQPGDGTVVRVGAKQYAVSKGDDGRITVLSATCTHLGCVVSFNTAERSWDCPCHGSRFAADGTVLHGPAVNPLERQSLPGP
ncbi:MAG: FAD-dependent oxidoreductase [Euzebyales bacterium]|nr:FAD-dependent oxidoreductase [Euzebyales bacterium]